MAGILGYEKKSGRFVSLGLITNLVAGGTTLVHDVGAVEFGYRITFSQSNIQASNPFIAERSEAYLVSDIEME